jgi:TonB-dependent SusC/RagA subfamily outer membrane receptor
MKRSLLFILLLFFQFSFGQLTVKVPISTDFVFNDNSDRRSTDNCGRAIPPHHCLASVSHSNLPLFVIDQVVATPEELKNLNPDNILSLTILKSCEAQALYGSAGINGVILIETRKVSGFIVKDSLDGHIIPFATVFFTNKGTVILTLIANDSGCISTEKLKNGSGYAIVVYAAGYKKHIDTIKTSNGFKKQAILLSRSEKAEPGTFNLYPNPATKGQQINIEFNNRQLSNATMRLVGSDGKTIFQKEVIVEKGLQHLTMSTDRKWAAGSYFIQLVSGDEKLILQKQVLIQ